MALKAVLSSLDGLEDGVKALYRQEGDRYVLDVEGSDGWGLEDVTGLKSALSKANQKVHDFEKRFKNLDPDEARAAIAAAKQAQEDKAKTKKQDDTAELDARLKQIEEKHQAELEEKEQAYQALHDQVTAVLIDRDAISALSASDAKDNVNLLLPHVKSAARLEKDKDGNYVVRMVGPDGNILISPKSGSVEPMTISEYVSTTLAEQFPGAFAGSGATGGGFQGANGGPGKKGSRRDYSKIEDPTERLRQYYEDKASSESGS